MLGREIDIAVCVWRKKNKRGVVMIGYSYNAEGASEVLYCGSRYDTQASAVVCCGLAIPLE